MSFLKSQGPIDSVKDILKLNTTAGIALIQYHSAVMRQPSELSEKDRELIAAYVSGLNACQYCYGVHSVTAETYGIDESLLVELLNDIESASLDTRMKPVLAYAKQLTQEPAKMTQTLVDNVLAAGWSDAALHDIVNVVCLFNFMNRLVEGHGIEGSNDLFQVRGKALKESGYEPLLKVLENGAEDSGS